MKNERLYNFTSAIIVAAWGLILGAGSATGDRSTTRNSTNYEVGSVSDKIITGGHKIPVYIEGDGSRMFSNINFQINYQFEEYETERKGYHIIKERITTKNVNPKIEMNIKMGKWTVNFIKDDQIIYTTTKRIKYNYDQHSYYLELDELTRARHKIPDHIVITPFE